VTDEQKIEFGKLLTELRLNAKLSMQKLADISGVDVEYVKRMEKGKHEPCLMTQIALADALQIKPGKFTDTIVSRLEATKVLNRFRS
jgi:transcriptional regulator with XRE-family HTH domain